MALMERNQRGMGGRRAGGARGLLVAGAALKGVLWGWAAPLALLVMAGSVSPAGARPAGVSPAAGYRATVVSVGDGDSLRVERQGRPITIRLACIDAPELLQSPWGLRSRDHLRQRLPEGRMVHIQPLTRDRYGRIVAEVISDINLGLAMVEDGQAFVNRRYLGGCDGKEYLEAEFRASRHRFGVWSVEGGITRPWDFRRDRGATRIPHGRAPDGGR